MEPGTYCLILRNPLLVLPVGALGDRVLPEGWHVYIGSALGPGGLARVERHIRLYHLKDRPPRWHIDYLLLHPLCRLEAVARVPSPIRAECGLAARLPGRPVPGFGCSDCDCSSHLFSFLVFPGDAVQNTCTSLCLQVTITMIDYGGE